MNPLTSLPVFVLIIVLVSEIGLRFDIWRAWILMTNAGYQDGASNKQRTDTVCPPADTGSGGNSLCSSTVCPPVDTGGGVSLVWQSSVNGYLYVVYDSQCDFYENLLKLPPGKRYMYELIRVGSVCRNYVDIELQRERVQNQTCALCVLQQPREGWMLQKLIPRGLQGLTL